MTLTRCSRLDAADWIAGSGLPWEQLVRFGPEGFEAYARLRILPDPAWDGQSENDVEAEDWRSGQLPLLFGELAAYTTTPDDCYVCVWEGFSTYPPEPEREVEAQPRADARPGLAPPVERPAAGPRVVVPHREYWLFRGPLSAAAELVEPAFVWPADRAWCVTKDVDPHWAGIGAPARVIDQLVADPRLDVVVADPAEAQPFYR